MININKHILKLDFKTIFLTLLITPSVYGGALNPISSTKCNKEGSQAHCSNAQLYDAVQGLKTLPTDLINMVDEFCGHRFKIIAYTPSDRSNLDWADVSSGLTVVKPIRNFLFKTLALPLNHGRACSVHIDPFGSIISDSSYKGRSVRRVMNPMKGVRTEPIQGPCLYPTEDFLSQFEAQRINLDAPPYSIRIGPEDMIAIGTRSGSVYALKKDPQVLKNLIETGSTQDYYNTVKRSQRRHCIKSLLFKAMCLSIPFVSPVGLYWIASKDEDYRIHIAWQCISHLFFVQILNQVLADMGYT